MKLYIQNNPDPIHNPGFILQMDSTPAPNDYLLTSDPTDWGKAWDFGVNTDDLTNNGVNVVSNPKVNFRNYMIENCLAGWPGYNDQQKIALVKRFIYPDGTTEQELDSLGTTSDQRLQWRQGTATEMHNITECSRIYNFGITANNNKCIWWKYNENGGLIDPPVISLLDSFSIIS